MIEGGCLCGGVRYQVDGPMTDVCHCHCSMCRRLSGAAFTTSGSVQRESFRWTRGQNLVRTYHSSADVDRKFCGNCGSQLQCLYHSEPDELYIELGTIDGDPGCRPAYHIFVESKAEWYEITDQLPQHGQWKEA